MTPLAVIILNWNGWTDTIECLESMLKSTLDEFIIILIDNGSEDESVKEILNWLKIYPHELNSIHVIKERKRNNVVMPILIKGNKKRQRDFIFINNKENLGYAISNNIGIRYALRYKCDKVLLLNNDTVVTPESLESLSKYMDKNDRFSILTPVICYYNHPDRIWNAGGKLTWWGGRRYYYSKQYYPSIIKCSAFNISFVTGCAMLVKMDIFKKYKLGKR